MEHHYIQDAPDQKVVVDRYCRYVREVPKDSTVKPTTVQGLQFATSNPKGPIYLTGGRDTVA